ncbi:MAG TPA: sulfatase [Vicinamibacterales bacterium]|nr:sulfatase [Vicinamibacterales bacterium]
MFRWPRRDGMHRRVVLPGCFLPVCLGGCATPARPPEASSSVLIVTLDTTRADYVSAYGSMRVWTPNLDRLAADGVVFEQAMTVAPLTLPAHCSLFTGLLPPRHGVRDNAGASLAASYQTLAEVLQRRGFETGAFVGSVVLEHGRGLEAGFDVYSDGITTGRTSSGIGLQRRADQIVDEAIAWLEERDRAPFLLWVHLYDPHAPYAPPEPFRTAYGDDPYAGEVAFADAQVGRLLDALDGRRRLDRPVVVVVGDHGESLTEHGETGHGIFIYQNVIRVPLIIRAAGVAPRRVAEVTRLVDVMPTVLELVAVSSPATDGVSLVATMTGRVGALDLEAYSESLYPERFGWSPLRALRAGRFKLIEAPRPELYDLQTDPTEQHNIHATRPAVATAMSRRLAALAQLGPTAREGHFYRPARETLERLAALGYVAAGRTTVDQPGPVLPDPKDHIGEYSRLARRRHEPRTPTERDLP